MKKFFKTLALLLALTLVIGTIPASAAENKVVESKILFVDGAQGQTEAGKACKIGKRVALWKLAGFESKAAYADHEIKATVADETVAHATKYFVYADAIGKTKVTLTIDGEKAGEVALQVKKNATADSLVITGLEESGEYVVGGTYEVTLPRGGKDTDFRALTIEGATVTAGEKARTYVVSFPKAGEYEVKYSAFQSKSFPKATQEKSFKVTVKYAKAEIAQTASDTFTLTFPENVDLTGSVNADTFAASDIFYMIGVSEVPFSFVKEASAKANVVTVKMASAFAAKEVYTVVFGGVEYTLTGAGVGVKDVASMEITTKSVNAGEDAEISYKFYNAAGVEIALATVASSLTLDTKSDDAYVVDYNHIKFFEKEKTADFTAVVSQGFDDDWNPIEVKATATIVSVEKAAAAYTGTMITSFEAVGAAYITKETKAEKLTSYMTVGEVKNLQALFQYSDGKDTTYTNFAGMGFDFAQTADGNIALVTNDDTVNNIVGITAVAEGKTNVIFYKTVDGKEVPQLVIPVVVKEARKASTLTIAKQSTAYINYANPTDEIVVDLEVKDQYGNYIAPATALTAKQNDANKAAVAEIAVPAIVPNGTGKYKMTIPYNIYAAAANTPKVFKIEIQDTGKKLAAVSFSFSVNNTTEAKSTVLTAENEAINTALVGYHQDADTIKDATIKLVNTNGNYKVVDGTKVLTVELAKAPTTEMKKATGAASTYYAFYMTKDGEVKATTALANVDFAGGVITFDAIAADKLAKGVYKVFAYKVEVKPAGTTYTAIGSKTITVTDSQVTPNYKLVKSVYTSDVSECFEWYFNGQNKGVDIGTVTYDTVNGDNNQIFVSKAHVSVDLKEGITKTFDITINKLFSK